VSESKLSPVSWTELVKRLRKLGFEGPYQGGKHPYMIKNDGSIQVFKVFLDPYFRKLFIRVASSPNMRNG